MRKKLPIVDTWFHAAWLNHRLRQPVPFRKLSHIPKFHLAPLTGEAREAGAAGEELLHHALLDITLLRYEALERISEFIRITQDSSYGPLFLQSWNTSLNAGDL